jgi:small subunit ribosomal protein S8
MNYNDTLSDLITKIRNGHNARMSSVIHWNTNITTNLLNVLYEEGYIRGYKEIENNKLEVFLKYVNNVPVINEIQRISKPGRKIYYNVDQLSKINNGLYLYVVSTSKGVFSLRKALLNNAGGELLCKLR